MQQAVKFMHKWTDKNGLLLLELVTRGHSSLALEQRYAAYDVEHAGCDPRPAALDRMRPHILAGAQGNLTWKPPMSPSPARPRPCPSSWSRTSGRTSTMDTVTTEQLRVPRTNDDVRSFDLSIGHGFRVLFPIEFLLPNCRASGSTGPHPMQTLASEDVPSHLSLLRPLDKLA
ncbi:hypothetical protein FB451DRAFT_1564274 [Mycena latifolia]|nr:hypothetical protein FB451DRAFT_1564274 [Mycena latifolia]